jgi:uncharacterized protein (TIRG00374 family)
MRAGWRGLFGIALGAGLLWYVLKDEDLGKIWGVLSNSNALLWLASTIFATLIFPLRARRWQALLAPTYGRLPFKHLWEATAIGMMMNNAVGFRSGEPARAFALTRSQPQVKFTAAFASLAVDRLFDGVVVMAMLLYATLDPAFRWDQTFLDRPLEAYIRATIVFLSVILAGALFLLFAPDFTARMIDAVAGRMAPKFAPKIRGIVESFTDGLRVLRRPALMAEVVFWTLLHWFCNAFAFWLGFKALGLSAPFTAALLIQGLIAILVALPGAPGFFGTFELAGAAGLAFYGIARTEAVSWVLAFHILSWIPIVIFGVVYLSRMKISLRDIRAGGDKSPPPAGTG